MLEQINQLVGTMGQNRPAAAAALHINMIKGLVDILAETGEVCCTIILLLVIF